MTLLRFSASWLVLLLAHARRTGSAPNRETGMASKSRSVSPDSKLAN